MVPPARVLEDNLDRVVDSVLRTLAAGGVTPPSAVPGENASAAEAQVRETIADLCGHVAFALKSLELRPHGLATYHAPAPPAGAQRSLDVRR